MNKYPRRHMAAVTVLLFLGGCVPQMLFDKPGVAPGAGQGDVTDCEVEALAKVPPSYETRRTIGMPQTTYVDCIGASCTATTYGNPSRSYSVDANKGLRNRVLVQCMERKGYTLRK